MSASAPSETAQPFACYPRHRRSS